MFGAFGLLALGLVYFCLRYATGNRFFWSDYLGVRAFWLYNFGLFLWIILNFFPIGWSQLINVYQNEFAHSRSLEFYNPTPLWQWLRPPGDIVFAIGALLMAYDFIVKLRPFFPNLASNLDIDLAEKKPFLFMFINMLDIQTRK